MKAWTKLREYKGKLLEGNIGNLISIICSVNKLEERKNVVNI